MQQLIQTKIDYLEDRYQAALADPQHWARPEEPLFRPAYFNTGCCAFDNGNVSALEVTDGEIRMVQWEGGDDPVVRRNRPLAEVLQRVA